jgi:hypothetical protein
MKKLFFLIASLYFLHNLYAQMPSNFHLDMKLKGYIFLTHNGLFFQPIDRNVSKDFFSSLDNRSFKIFQNHESIWSSVIKGVGEKVITKKYFTDSSDTFNETKNKDTLFFFKALIEVNIVFGDTNRTKFNDIGYGFIYKQNMIDYGNSITDNYLYSLVPEEKNIIKELYYSYKKSNYLIPIWLESIYQSSKNETIIKSNNFNKIKNKKKSY